MTTEKKLMTAEDLLMLPDDGCRRELLDGVVVEMSPAGGQHAEVMSSTSFALRAYVVAHDLGVVVVGDPGIMLRRNPDRVRAPDVCFFARERLKRGQSPRGYYELVPDLVIGIISPNDRAGEVQEKIQEWLAAGARLVWAMYPATRSIVAYSSLGDARVFGEATTIDAEPILPGFSARVADLFS